MTAWISPDNVSRVAMLVLEMQPLAIDERYQADAAFFIQQLQAALAQYRNPAPEMPAGNRYGSIEALEQCLRQLLDCTRQAVHLLTPLAHAQLREAVYTSLAAPKQSHCSAEEVFDD